MSSTCLLVRRAEAVMLASWRDLPDIVPCDTPVIAGNKLLSLAYIHRWPLMTLRGRAIEFSFLNWGELRRMSFDIAEDTTLQLYDEDTLLIETRIPEGSCTIHFDDGIVLNNFRLSVTFTKEVHILQNLCAIVKRVVDIQDGVLRA